MVVIIWPYFFSVKIGYRYEYQSTYSDSFYCIIWKTIQESLGITRLPRIEFVKDI